MLNPKLKCVQDQKNLSVVASVITTIGVGSSISIATITNAGISQAVILWFGFRESQGKSYESQKQEL
jgi:hypothetical protein